MAETKKTYFHYVFTENNTISGRSVLRQTEDAINDLGSQVSSDTSSVEEAIKTANEALTTAQEAVQQATNAVAQAQEAVATVNNLQIIVENVNSSVQDALSRAQTAVTQSTTALENSQSALEQAEQAKEEAQSSAESASESAQSALEASQSAEDAKNSANEALELANQAVADAQEAQQKAEDAYNECVELAKSCYCWRIYNGDLSGNEEIPIDELTPQGNVKEGDLVVGTDGRIFQIINVYTNDENVEVAQIGTEYFNFAPYVSYGGLQGLTAEQQQIARQNIGISSLLTEYTYTDETDLNHQYDSARLHVPEYTTNAPTTDAYFVDVDVNSGTNPLIRQVAVKTNSSEVYIRWGVEVESDDDDEDEGVEWTAWELISGGGSDFSMTSIIAQTPNYYKRASLFSSDKTTITIPANTQVNIGNQGYISTADTTLSVGDYVSASDRAGKDLYLYACQPDDGSSEPTFVISANSTVPDGYSSDNSRKIGGLHCLCLSAGTISGCDASGYDTGDVIPISLWDLLFRANSENEGMVYWSGLGRWYDIYLTSFDGTELQSVYGGTIADGYSSEPFHGDKFAEYAGRIGKRLLWRDEFIMVAKGSNECTNISGSADPVTTGGHTDTAGRRMISNAFLEDCCGAMWQWNMDCWGAFNRPATSTTYQYGGANTSGNHYIDGCGWDKSYNSDGTSRNLHVDIDGSNDFGDCYGVLLRALSGAVWGDGSSCGSRSVSLSYLSSSRYTAFGCRCASEPRVVNL